LRLRRRRKHSLPNLLTSLPGKAQPFRTSEGEARHKGGEWTQAGFLLTSPGTFAVTPSPPGEAEQIEVRAFFIQKNNTVGNPSDAKAAFIAP
jgi:hypothetical protein